MSAGAADSARTQRGRGAFDAVVDRPVAITMIFLATAVFGLVSLDKLPVNLLPEISYPTLTVRTSWAGAAPADVEDLISEPVQEALSTIPKLVRATSISRSEASDVVLEFEWGTPMTFAVQDVRDKLDGVFLPQGVERPLILRYDPNLDPVLRIGIGSVGPSAEGAPAEGASELSQAELIGLRWLAENRIKRELEGQGGVAAVIVRGGLEEEVRVRVDPHKLAALGLEPDSVAQRLAQENINASGGLIREGSTEYLVRTLNEFQSLAEIEDLALVKRGASVIRLSDVATVSRGHAEREVVTRLDGRQAVEIAVYREAGANIVDLAQRVKQYVFGTAEQQAFTAKLAQEGQSEANLWGERDKTDYLAWRFRRQARLELLSDQSIFIRDSIADLKSSAIGGALLAILVLWVFLRRVAPTFIVAMTIPVTVVATFAPMFMFDVSLNIMSLGGLALGAGMLVDNSIVVLESIERNRKKGMSFFEGTVRGTSEVVGAVTASTLTTVAVFLPIVFVDGVAGQIFGDQALTVVASQVISLFVGIVFIPMLASRRWLQGETTPASEADRPPRILSGARWTLDGWIASASTALGRTLLGGLRALLRLLAGSIWLLARSFQWATGPLLRWFDRLWSALERLYPRMVERCFALTPLLLAGIAGLAWFAAVRFKHLGVDLLPEIHQGEFTLHVGLDVGSPLEATDGVLRAIDREVRALDGVEITALSVGVEKETLSREIEGKHTARLTVRLSGVGETAASNEGSRGSLFEREEALLASIRALIAARPEVKSVDVSRPTPFALEAPVTIEILGRDLERMEAVALDVFERVRAIPGLADVRSSVRVGNPEVRVTFDRDKMLEFGLDLASVANLVRDQVLGKVTTRFDQGEQKIDVRVIGDEVVLSDLERVLSLVVNPGSTVPVELKSIAEISRQQGPAEIRRIGNLRAMVVTAASEQADLGAVSRRVEDSLRDLPKPDEVGVELGGQKREMDSAQKSLRGALLLAIFLVYVVMACQFESLLQPLIIMVSVPLAAIGVVLGLDLLEIPLSVTVFLGLILLAGIVVNNAIVLLDRINQRRDEGDELRAAVLEACSARLRPILMTSATTVLGLLPLTGWFDGLPLVGWISGGGAGAELRAPMAIAVVLGMSISTLLTLIVIPTVYYHVARWTDGRARSSGEVRA